MIGRSNILSSSKRAGIGESPAVLSGMQMDPGGPDENGSEYSGRIVSVK